MKLSVDNHRIQIGVIIYLIMVSLSFMTTAGAQTPDPPAKSPIRWDVLLYYVPLDYGDSQFKKTGDMTGMYTYLGYGLNHAFEAELDYTHVDYIWIDDIKQWDVTLAYTYFTRLNYKFRLGAHYVISDEETTNDVWTLFGGVNRYVYRQWNVQLDGYYSRYPNYAGLGVVQLTPRAGFYFGNRVTSTFYFQTRGYYIHLSDRLKLYDPVQLQFFAYTDPDMFSVEESITYYRGPWTLTTMGWIGDQMFAVKSDGFLVNNVEELHSGGYGISLNYAHKMSSLTVGYYVDHVEERHWNNPRERREVRFQKYVISLGHTF
ncbi:MAG: hypothetical protein D6675_02310 [Gemmatimonadetes bacterium]|nr:MAG: hypothetical protein D6675_02310 [Gemmatimonadota bacterium]